MVGINEGDGVGVGVGDDGGGGRGSPESPENREEASGEAARLARLGHRVEVRTWEDELGVGWDYATTRGPDTPLCGYPLVRRRGERCERSAGAGTGHPGAGPCHGHVKTQATGGMIGAWVVAHGFARALECTPWDGLLWAVRIAAGRVAFIEQKLGTATCDEDLQPEGQLWHWVKQAEVWHDKLMRSSKLAIDAGVAERLVRQLELEAQLMLKATRLTLDELGLDDDTRQRALGIMSRNLLTLEAEELGTREEAVG